MQRNDRKPLKGLSSLEICYQGTVNVLSGHPRWMFRKNSMEFFVGLQPYLYYYYSGCILESHGHMSFPECSMVTWPCYVTWLTKSLFCLCLYSVVCLGGFSLSVQMHGKPFPARGSHNTVNVLSDHPRWMFKKNSIEFFVGLQPYLYYYYSGCTLESHDHMFFPEYSMITWPCHVIWLTKSPPYLYPYSIVCFEVLD